MNKDRLGHELKRIMEDETKELKVSQELKDSILLRRHKTLRDKIKEFLNREIEIPLIPMIASLALIIVVVGVPRDLINNSKNIKVVNIGSSQMIFRDEKRVSRND